MEDLELKEIGQFYGTTQYYNVMGINATEGIKYIMDNGYAWVVTDAAVIIRMLLKNEKFVLIKLKLNKEEGTAIIEYSDGNNNKVHEQKYEWTNAKKNLKLYYSNGVLMLPGEY